MWPLKLGNFVVIKRKSDKMRNFFHTWQIFLDFSSYFSGNSPTTFTNEALKMQGVCSRLTMPTFHQKSRTSWFSRGSVAEFTELVMSYPPPPGNLFHILLSHWLTKFRGLNNGLWLVYHKMVTCRNIVI